MFAPEMMWQPRSEPVVFNAHQTPEFVEWDLSELFAADPRTPSSGFIPSRRFAAESDSDYHPTPTTQDSVASLPIHYNNNPPPPRMEYIEHNYDIFNAAPSPFGARYRSDSTASSSVGPSPALSPAGDMYFSSPHSSFSGSPASTHFEILSSSMPLGSVPEDPSPHSQPSSYNGSPFTSASSTVSPGAIHSPTDSFRPEPSFAELMMDRQSSTGYVEPFTSLPQNMQPGYSFVGDPSSSTRHEFANFDMDDTSSSPIESDDVSPYGDMNAVIRPYLDQFLHSPSRLSAGEQTVIVMSSRVAQKSYGTEKRFLCPPPTAVLIGNRWLSEAAGSDSPRVSAPHVTVSISGEPTPSDGVIEWSTPAGMPVDPVDAQVDDTTHIGRCVGKQLFISESDIEGRKKRVEAMVKITAQHGDRQREHVIGVFRSRPIKVISKPSKKRQSAKNLELCINHGSTVSLFHRLRSQTVSTKYLCVSGSGSSFKGSDGSPLPGLDPRQRTSAPSFVAKTAHWDMFIIYIVDVNKPNNGPDSVPPAAPNPDYPPPPPNAIACPSNGSAIPIYYNQTVVLQCLTSGVVSPVLVIRKVDHATVIVGGGLQDGAKGIPDSYCIPGEVCGDPVSQLHKIALEVYEPGLGPTDVGGPGNSGAFLSCMGEKVNTYRPVDLRQWNGLSMSSPSMSGSPVPTTPVSAGSGSLPDHYPPMSPDSVSSQFDYMSADGGRVRRKRGSLSSINGKAPPAIKGRRRVNSVSSTSSSSRNSTNDQGTASGALWSINVGETAVWTIVGTDQVRYNFYVPPTGSSPPSMITPFPTVAKYLPPDRAGEAAKSGHPSRNVSTAPSSQYLTLYGEHFSMSNPPAVFFGSEPSARVEVRSSEVLVCVPPENALAPNGARRPIILVRSDGVVFPTNVMYP